MNCIGFPPSIDAGCHTLILGSMPGVASLKQQQYYAHPQNRFWPLMTRLLGEASVPSAYPGRLHMLLCHHIALWDSIGTCDRDGSLDSAIKTSRAMTFPPCSKAILPSAPSALTAENLRRLSAAIIKRFSAVTTLPSMSCHPPVLPMPAGAWKCSPKHGAASSTLDRISRIFYSFLVFLYTSLCCIDIEGRTGYNEAINKNEATKPP